MTEWPVSDKINPMPLDMIIRRLASITYNLGLVYAPQRVLNIFTMEEKRRLIDALEIELSSIKAELQKIHVKDLLVKEKADV